MGTVDDMMDRHEENRKQVERLARALHFNVYGDEYQWNGSSEMWRDKMRRDARAMIDYMDNLEVE